MITTTKHWWSTKSIKNKNPSTMLIVSITLVWITTINVNSKKPINTTKMLFAYMKKEKKNNQSTAFILFKILEQSMNNLVRIKKQVNSSQKLKLLKNPRNDTFNLNNNSRITVIWIQFIFNFTDSKLLYLKIYLFLKWYNLVFEWWFILSYHGEFILNNGFIFD